MNVKAITKGNKLRATAGLPLLAVEKQNLVYAKERLRITAETMLDGTPDAVKVACPVTILRLHPQREGYFEVGDNPYHQHQR